METSQSKNATKDNELVDEKSDSANFLFINVEENIKKEKIEDKHENEDAEERFTGSETPEEDSPNAEKIEDEHENEDAEERVTGYETPEEDFPNAGMDIEDEGEEEKSPSFGSEKIESERDSSSDGLNRNSSNNNRAFSCNKCSISFVSPVYLKGHKNRCRATKTGVNTRVEKTEKAFDNGCDHKKPTHRKVKSRVPIGELKHKCNTCGRGFVRMTYLRAHEATHATVFKCDECPYTTEHLKNLRRHNVVHYGEDEKIYSCPHCSYTAGKSSYLRKHMAKHAEVKPFKCNVCPYETAVMADLAKHRVTHGGEKAFACSHCYYSSARKAQLAKHLEKFHSTQTETGT